MKPLTMADVAKQMQELDWLTARIQKMRGALELGLKCGCVRIEDCTLTPADAEGSGLRKSRCDRSC